MRTLDPATASGARALERLETEPIGWLTTVNPDGQPQSSPIWFRWVDGELLLYSHKNAPRNRNIARRPLVAFNLHTDAGGGDVVTMEGDARVDPAAGPVNENAPFIAKYRRQLDADGWTPEYFATEYPVPILVRPTRWRLA